MGDSVGVHGPHAVHAEDLTRKILGEQGFDVDALDPEDLRDFSRSMSTLSPRPLTEEQFMIFVRDNPRAATSWAYLKSPEAVAVRA